jgi:hypothetical protein
MLKKIDEKGHELDEKDKKYKEDKRRLARAKFQLQQK